MNTCLLQVVIAAETDLVQVRSRTRRLAELVGFDLQDQTRITTAVSEIVRNAYEYAHGGHISFRLTGEARRPNFEIVVRDRGPGIRDLDAVLSGTRKSPTGMGIGLTGARRLMDDFEIVSLAGEGTTVRLAKALPANAGQMTPAMIRSITARLAADGPADAVAEITRQNQQILLQLEELRERQEDLQRLNQELQDTNRGVVALYAELDERADHLRRADELKSKFLSHMSHEFRTPLNSIIALSRLLLSHSDGELTAEQETQVGFIRKAAQNLTELVDDLLDLAKVEAGKTTVVGSQFSIASLFGALRGMLRPLLIGDNVALLFDDPHNAPLLDTDEGKLSQILRNFISNAIKFTEKGEVRVWATADPVTDTVSLHVRDTGIGIAASDVDVIFQEFGQVTHRLQGRVKGTGLGLPLAKKLAELLGGAITVNSVLGEGSTFTVTIPRIYDASEPQEADDDWSIETGQMPVLVVDDDPADALAIQRLLAESIYQPLIARSVRDARRFMQSVQPAAILLDIILAGDESWRLLLELRSQDASNEIPVIVTSSTGDVRKAVHLGADDYVAKPVDREGLIDALDRVTGRHSAIRVLLVDDEEVTHYLVRQLLPRSRYRLWIARDDRDALERLAEYRPDVILLDLAMPGTDGFAFLSQLRQEISPTELPVIVLTSAVLDPLVRSSLSSTPMILSKSELASDTLINAIGSVLSTEAGIGAG
jgi:signal transduction histidine kinase/DNA-binding response OmpR family regulator